jgi:putative tryptophan/tyrosine transport system substrate-binding protein
MNRREFIALLGGAAAWPLAARGQANPFRIGFLPIGSPSNAYDRSLVEAFREGLREAGLVENRDIFLDLAWINNEPELPQAVAELIQRGANLLVPCGTSASVAAKAQTATLPILFINVGNPIGVGLVQSLPHPGGNVTGFSDMHADLSGKYVEFATELDKTPTIVNYLWYTEWADG